ncbi:MAG TPA: hypothetical protein VLB03_08845, partial [Nocardioidaceae bacterium]|nr:hypothetical protein [Nocardioidaceae bacterium]
MTTRSRPGRPTLQPWRRGRGDDAAFAAESSGVPRRRLETGGTMNTSTVVWIVVAIAVIALLAVVAMM